jgi:hypothetical protein
MTYLKGLAKGKPSSSFDWSIIGYKKFYKVDTQVQSPEDSGQARRSRRLLWDSSSTKEKKSSSSTKYPSFYQAIETLLFSSDPRNGPRIEVSIWPKVSDFILVGNCVISTPPKCVC